MHVKEIRIIGFTACDSGGANGYIGKKYLNQAIETVLSNPNPKAPKPVAFSVLRVPFFLEPQYDESKPFIESNRDRLVKKWGGTAGWEAQKNRHDLKGRGMEAGIPHFNLDRLASNTMASHRLIQMLGKRYGLDVSEAIYDRLNIYYFVEGHALNDRPLLAKIVAAELQTVLNKRPSSDVQQTSMDADELLVFLNGNEGRKEIYKALNTLEEMGVHGIPKFIIEGHTLVDGAARSDVFVRAFRDIEARGTLRNGPIFGDILGVSAETLERGSHHRIDGDKMAM